MKKQLFALLSGFFVMSSGVVGYQISNQSIEQSKADQQSIEQSHARTMAYLDNDYSRCMKTFGILLDDAKKYGSPSNVIKARSNLDSCEVLSKTLRSNP